ncbi:hypothetical protein NQ315_015332 [Exocentrus adspersus]|uniref:Uncharacterized protein n=1 Tax=Exocentrus adspersus TaxID=1586481 RepID=A0AAV8V666_9CUCU|nr:hypothetical protein NQ315_015332 [Exocentrus adspersus]
MSISSFDELHHKLENDFKFSDCIRASISSVERLCVVALRSLSDKPLSLSTSELASESDK